MEIYDKCERKNIMRNVVLKTTSIKECFNPKEMTIFQLLMLEIRRNFILKVNQDTELGKSCFASSNLPPHIDPTYTSFGFRQRDPYSLADIIHEKYNYDFDSRNIIYPGTQINRKYEKPFCKHRVYGKATTANHSGYKTGKLIYCSLDPQKYQDYNFDEIQTNISDAANYLTPNVAHATEAKTTNIYEILHTIPVNKKDILMKMCLGHVNSIRLLSKRHSSKINFTVLKNRLQCISKNAEFVTLDIFYDVLKKVKLILDPEIFEYLLNEFQLINNDLVNYKEALNLLNCKYEFPPLPEYDDKINDDQRFVTTYEETMKV